MSAVDVPARRFFLLVLAFLLVALLPFPTLAQDVWVNKDATPVDIGGETITEPGHNDNAGTAADTPVRTLTRALDKAQSDSTIYVGPGVYGETITVSDDNISLIAGGADTTIIRDTGLADDLGVEVTADSVTIRNFSIEDFGNGGLFADGVTELTLKNLNVTNTGDTGLSLIQSLETQADSILVSQNNGVGIHVREGNSNEVIRSKVSNNGNDGMLLQNTQGDTVRNSTISSNDGDGLVLGSSTSNLVQNNQIESNGTTGGHGIWLNSGSHDNRFINNTIQGHLTSGFHGAQVEDSDTNVFRRNIAQNNNDGFRLIGTNRTRFLRNLSRNNERGFWFGTNTNIFFVLNQMKNNSDVELEFSGSADLFQRARKNNFLVQNTFDKVRNTGNEVEMPLNWWGVTSSDDVRAVFDGGDIEAEPYRLNIVDTFPGADTVAPEVPPNFQADTSTADQIRLTWNDISTNQEPFGDGVQVNEFRVYRSVNDSSPLDWKDNQYDTITLPGSGDTTTLVDTNVTTSNTYYYRITAADEHTQDTTGVEFENESYYSNVVDATPENYGPEIYVNDAEHDTDVFTEAAGDDSKNGTPQNPLRTLQRASEVSQDNDTIYVDAGTYTDTATIDTGGVAVVGAGRDTTVFDVNYSGTAIRVNQEYASGEGNLLKNFTVRDAVTGVSFVDGVSESHLMNVEVRGSTVGVSSSGSQNRIFNGLFTNNVVGVQLSGANNLVAQNQIAGNASYQVSISDVPNEVRRNNIIPSSTQPDSGVNTGGNTPNLTYNWWNATDSTVIRARQSSPGEYIPHRLGFVDTGVGADSVAPAAPSENEIEVDTSVAREITLRWDRPVEKEDGSTPGTLDLEGYNIYRLENEGDTDDWTLHHRATINDPSDTDFTDAVPDIEKDQGYFYRITSFDTNDNGVFNESYFTDVHAGTWVNRVPRAGTATVETQVDSSVSFTLTGSDSDADTLAYNIVSGPDSGTLDTAPRSGPGSGIDTAVTYRPDTPFVGTDSFRFTVSDGDGGVDTGTITIETLVETSIRVERFRVDGQDTPLVAGRGDTFEARVRFSNTESGPGEVFRDTSALEIRDGQGNVVNDSFNVTRAGTGVRVDGNDTAVGRWVVDYPQSNEPQLHGNFRVVLDFNDITARNVFQGNVKDVGDSLVSNSRTLNVLPEPIDPDDFGLDTGGVSVQSVELDLGIVNDEAVLDTDAAEVDDGDSIFRMIQRGDTASIDTPVTNPSYGFQSPNDFNSTLTDALNDMSNRVEFNTRNLRILRNNLLTISLWKNETLSDSNFISPGSYLGDPEYLRESSVVTVRGVKYREETARLRVVKLVPGTPPEWTLVDNLNGTVNGTPKVTGEEGNYTVRFEVSADTGFSVFQIIASGVVKDGSADEAVVYPNPFVPFDNNDRTGCYSGCGRSGIFFGAGPDRGFPAGSRIKIYNVKGEMIDEFTLFDGGIFQWDAETRNGERVASGVYIYRIETPEGSDRNGKFAIVR